MGEGEEATTENQGEEETGRGLYYTACTLAPLRTLLRTTRSVTDSSPNFRLLLFFLGSSRLPSSRILVIVTDAYHLQSRVLDEDGPSVS